MIFHTRPEIQKQFETVLNFKIKNLIVSGCSFTHNNSMSASVAWPYYLRDLGGFENVFDTSLPAAGNYHISNSLIWALESESIHPEQSLVIVMWSGNDRDDWITPGSHINHYPFEFKYNDNAMSAISGGASPDSRGNTNVHHKEFFATQDKESRAIKNYLLITNTWHYLQNKGFRFVFLNFLDSNLLPGEGHFDIKKYLPKKQCKNLEHMIDNTIDPSTWAIKNDLLSTDDYHPSPDGHLSWTKYVLLPHLQSRFC
jgi:hypothetical protein